jgi:hypothetical protein
MEAALRLLCLLFSHQRLSQQLSILQAVGQLQTLSMQPACR